MILELHRIYKGPSYTIGHLYIDGSYFCDTLEDKDRGLDSSMSVDSINRIKVHGTTAIPTGTYNITLDVVSPRFSTKSFYKNVCDGKLPRLLNVKGFEGILIHAGNTDKDSAGCLLVGANKVKGQVINSRETFEKLYKVLKESRDRGEGITIKIL